MQVVERFVSINGEGVRAGELATFIRFKGCNLNCTYCDTSWANEVDVTYNAESPADICEYIVNNNIRNVTLTGGEPLLQEDIADLIDMICADNYYRVEIETNGSVDISAFRVDNSTGDLSFTMDYKLPSSGMESLMNAGNFDYLRDVDTVKFVVGTSEDLARAHEVIEKYNLTDRCHVYLSPVFGSIEPSDIVEYMMDKGLNDVRLQLQMHKIIWEPNKRGV